MYVTGQLVLFPQTHCVLDLLIDFSFMFPSLNMKLFSYSPFKVCLFLTEIPLSEHLGFSAFQVLICISSLPCQITVSEGADYSVLVNSVLVKRKSLSGTALV